MISKIIGISIIGLVLSFGAASLAESFIEDYSTSFQYTDFRTSPLEHTFSNGEKSISPYKIIQAERKYSSTETFNAFFYLGMLLTLIIIIHIANCADVYQNMAYALFFCLSLGFFLGFYCATEDIGGRYHAQTTIHMEFADKYLLNSIYIGFSVSALIFGLNLANKKPNT